MNVTCVDRVCSEIKEKRNGVEHERERERVRREWVLNKTRNKGSRQYSFLRRTETDLSRLSCRLLRHQDSPLATRWIMGRLVSLSDLSSTAKMSVVGGRERLALLCLAGVKGGSGLEFQLNTSYMDEDILISANKSFNATQILGVPRKIFSKWNRDLGWEK